MPVTEFLARAIRPAIQSQFRVQPMFALWGLTESETEEQASLLRYCRVTLFASPKCDQFVRCACAHAILRQPHMFSFVIKMFDNFIRDPSANKGSRLCQRYTACAICCRQSKWHTLNLSLILHPSNPEKREAGACLIINMWDLWTAHLAFHTLFFSCLSQI